MKLFDISVLMTEELRTFLSGAHADPFRILGPHRVGKDVIIRVFRPDAREVLVKIDGDGKSVPAEKIHGDGLFQAALQDCDRDFTYMLKIKRWDDTRSEERRVGKEWRTRWSA